MKQHGSSVGKSQRCKQKAREDKVTGRHRGAMFFNRSDGILSSTGWSLQENSVITSWLDWSHFTQCCRPDPAGPSDYCFIFEATTRAYSVTGFFAYFNPMPLKGRRYSQRSFSSFLGGPQWRKFSLIEAAQKARGEITTRDDALQESSSVLGFVSSRLLPGNHYRHSAALYSFKLKYNNTSEPCVCNVTGWNTEKMYNIVNLGKKEQMGFFCVYICKWY